MKFNELKLNENGMLPVVVQDNSTLDVLMVAYMNEEAFNKTKEEKVAHFYSRSRNTLWKKGETSGNILEVKEMYFDCDNDTMLLKVQPKGPACHTGNYSCFYKKVDENSISEITTKPSKNIIDQIYDVIDNRVKNPKEGSYTNYLFEKGIDKMLKKVGEEAAEVIIAAKNREKSEVTYEVADLIYHLSVVLYEQDLTWNEIYKELEKRR